jgi:mRNA export factor
MTNFLLSTSWGGQISLWDVSKCSKVQELISDEPILSSCWHESNTAAFFGGGDGKVYAWQIEQGTKMQVGQHSSGVNFVKWLPKIKVLLTGGWDKKLYFWDMRGPAPSFEINLPERLYCGDVKEDACVVGTANRHLQIYNLEQPQKPFRDLLSPLKFQSKCISIFPNQEGFALGSIEGRVGIQHIRDNDTKKNFTFRCHRDKSRVHSVNSIAFHPTDGYFATGGSDGQLIFWNKERQEKVKEFSKSTLPITSCAFSTNGSSLAYSVGYDWTQGTHYAVDNRTHLNPHIYIINNLNRN